ncbi:restriction endonuclease subunit S [Streptococcus sp. UBA632]|uniref:restriction endonuclease subunit S n=1 Tax=Streptococcus sp. UBA632 TaxID=1947566 RepID=UPI0025DFEC33|nr:restriction endonuclease subunit S [Streptococcus sp. UBA632]
MKTKSKIPALRFKGFTDAWEERRLSEFVSFFNGLTYKPSDVREEGTLVLRSSNVKDGEIIDADNVYVTSEMATSENVKRGDIIVVVRNGSRALIGKHATIKEDMPNTVIGAFMSGIRTGFPSFVNALLDTSQFNKEIEKNMGATINQITGYMFSQMNFLIPSASEQQQIGTFFAHLDTLISLHQRKLDLLKEQKKGFLQKMFPKNGEKVPELRFAGFADDWEERRLREVTIYQNGKGYEDSQSSSGKFELINLNSISIDGGLKSSEKYIESADKTLLTDDLVMVLSDVGKGDLLGRVAIIPKDNYYVLNQRVALIRPKNKQQTNYLFSYINSHQRYFKLHGAGMSQLNISKGSVENFPLLLPSLPEQQQIGTFFAHLDTLISLHQRKLDLLKELKKALLRQLFV